jgi:hypothetical protein
MFNVPFRQPSQPPVGADTMIATLQFLRQYEFARNCIQSILGSNLGSLRSGGFEDKRLSEQDIAE